MGLTVTPGMSFGQGFASADPWARMNTLLSFGRQGVAPVNTGGPGNVGAGVGMAPPSNSPANIAIPGVQAAAPMAGGYGGGFMGPVAPQGAQVPAASVPAGDGQGWFQKMGGLEGLGSITSGLGDLAGIWSAIQQVGMARDQLRFDKSSYATNLANQTQSYNTTLEDRTRQRFAFEGKSGAEADTYLKAHSL